MFSKLRLSRKAKSPSVDIQQPAKYANPLQTITRSSPRIFRDPEPKSEHVPEHTASSTSSPQRAFNIVLFGETDDEKSSVINLIARKEIAAVPSVFDRCTMQYRRYDLPFDGVNFAIYDTAGLERPQIGAKEYLKATEQVYALIDKLGAAGGIHLLLFCLPAGRITATMQNNYRLFHECLCDGEVQIALVFTGLEGEAEMEDWWRRNKKDVEYYGIRGDDHACITTLQDSEDDHKFLASQAKIRQLLNECAAKHVSFSPEVHPWFARFARVMKGFIRGKVPKSNQIMKVLTQRCRLDQETARRVTAMIENGNVETNRGGHSSEGNGFRKEIGPGKNSTTLRLSSSEHADPPAGILNNESVANKHDEEDLRRIDGADEPRNEREAVGEPPTKDSSPPKEHADSQAGDGKEPVKKWTDESTSNGHDQKDQQAGIWGGGQTETRKVSANGDSLLDEHSGEEDRLSWKRRGSRERMTEAATQPVKGSSSDEHEEKVVQRTGPRQGDGREETEAATVSSSFLPKVHYRSEHSPAGKDESGSRDGWEIKVVKDSKMDGSSLDKNEELQATKVQNGGTRVPKVILTSNDPPRTWKDLSSDGESDRHSALAVDESMLNGREQKDRREVINGGKTETGETSTNGDPLLAEHRKKEGSKTGTPINQFWDELLPAIDLTGRVTKSDYHPFASGGYGDIYRGIYRSDEGLINVAIKTTRVYLQRDQPEQLYKNIKRFRREIAVWCGLRHPNVLSFLGTIRDPKTNPDIPAMVCPLAENGPLTVYIQENDMTFAKRLLLVDNVAHGLQYLHSQQIVHGDLSGSNVLIDGEGTACIADFGLSTLLTRLGGTTFATSHHAKGTMRWIAPELCDINDHNIVPTTQGDVYSFGCIMLQILTSKVPYHYFSNDAQVICAIMTGRKPKRPDGDVIDNNIWQFIEWCWSPVTAAEPCPRPSSDQIVAFTEMELGKLSKC